MPMTSEELILKMAETITNVNKASKDRDEMITVTIVEMTLTLSRMADTMRDLRKKIDDLKVRVDYLESKEGE
jgi:hypothetical protein